MTAQTYLRTRRKDVKGLRNLFCDRNASGVAGDARSSPVAGVGSPHASLRTGRSHGLSRRMTRTEPCEPDDPSIGQP
jgi:hypothetical protein